MPRIFSSRDIAKLVGADPSSINRWIDSGKLKAYRTPGGHRRVLLEELMVFLKTCGIPVPSELNPNKPLSVVLVDDDEMFLKTFKRALHRLDPKMEIRTCSSGIDALIQIGTEAPDAIVLDVLMPDLDGIEVCRKIRENPATSDTIIVAVTGRPDAATEERAKKAGASGYLQKPFKPKELLEAIGVPQSK